MRRLTTWIAVPLAALVALTPAARAAEVTKANNTDALNLGSSWVGGNAPTSADVGLWNNTVTAANTSGLTANLTLDGLKITNPGGLLGISPTAINSGTVTVNATTNTIAYTGTDVTDGNVVSFSQASGSIPGGLVGGRPYVVVNVDTVAKTYQVSTAVGGSPIDITSNGSNVSNSVQPALSLGGSGIDMATATQNLALLSAPVSLTAAQTWTVTTNRRIDTNNNTNNTGVNVFNNGHTLTVNVGTGGQVDIQEYIGTAGLTKSGAGTLVMMGTTYDFSGDVTVDAGVLNLKGATSFGSGASRIVMNGGTLTAQANNPRSFGRDVVVAGDAAFYNNNSTSSSTQSYSFADLSIGSHTFAVTANGSNDGTLTFATATLTGSPTFDVGSRAGNFLVLGAIGETGGTRSITKTGVGTLRVTGASSYTGTTTISDGILALTGSGALPAAGAVSAAGTLDISGITASGTTIGSLAGSGSVDLGTKSLTVGDATDTVFSGVVAGAGGSVTKQGVGTFTLSGTNTFGGTLTVSSGTLAVAVLNDASVAGPLGDSAAAVVLGGTGTTGTLLYTGSTATSTKPFTAAAGGTAAFSVDNAAATLTLSGLINGGGDKSFSGAGNTVVSGSISGGDVVKTGGGTLTLASLNGQADTTVNAGQLNINQFAALGTTAGALTMASGTTIDNTSGSSITVTNPKSIILGSSLTFVGSDDLDLGEGTTTLSATTTFDIQAGTLTLSGDVVGAGFGIVKDGVGTLRLDGLSGTGSFTGNSTINAGTLLLEGSSQLGGGAGTVVTLGENGFLQVGASASLNNVTIAGFTQNVISASVINANQTFSQAETLSSANANYNGVQTIASGVTVTTAANYLGTIPASTTAGRVVFENGATLAATAGFSIDPRQGVSLSAGTATVSVAAGQAVFLESAVAGSGGLRKTGAGNLRLTGTNSFQGGTVVEQGILGISSGAALGDVAGGLTIDGATLAAATNPDGSGSGATIDAARTVLIGNGKTNGLHAQNGLTLRYDGAISEVDAQAAAGGLQFGLAGPREGTVILGGANTYRGNTTLSAGTLKLGSGGSFAASPRIIVGDAAGSSAAVLDLTEKTSFTIGAGQTLAGKGRVLLGSGTSLTVDGTLSPGNSPGVLTYDGGGTVTLAGTTLLEIWGTARGLDPGYDGINALNGTSLALGGTLQLDFNQTFADGTTFSLFTPDGTSSLAGTFSSITMVGSAYTDLAFTNASGVWTTNVGTNNQSMSFDSSTGNLEILVVPEPAALPLLTFAAACCGLALRRRSAALPSP